MKQFAHDESFAGAMVSCKMQSCNMCSCRHADGSLHGGLISTVVFPSSPCLCPHALNNGMHLWSCECPYYLTSDCFARGCFQAAKAYLGQMHVKHYEQYWLRYLEACTWHSLQLQHIKQCSGVHWMPWLLLSVMFHVCACTYTCNSVRS